MGLSASLVRQFQAWIGSAASRPVTDEAARASEAQLARLTAMPADRLALSETASREARARASAATDMDRGVRRGVAPTEQPTKSFSQRLASRQVAMNRIHGDRREAIVQRYLLQRFPTEKGYAVHAEQFLLDCAGRVARDARTGEARRLDFVVFQGKKVISTVEVTSRTASKAAQLGKEFDIRKAGGRYLMNPTTGQLVHLPASQNTAILRLG